MELTRSSSVSACSEKLLVGFLSKISYSIKTFFYTALLHIVAV